ncbi:MAG: tetratricopeptide repeat protein, partial [Candidatus Falkowbacteria bacterium]|nr:tetratricopeptide repeat protein [Candidatus Falkowbacteria bacterium]
IGNYIYPAMCEGIVKDFYWVIPGTLKEFEQSVKFIKNMLKGFSRQDPYYLGRRSPACRQAGKVSARRMKDGIITTKIFGRKFLICILEKLPIFRQDVLLDIDADFLTTDSLLNANNTSRIGKRVPWIYPDRLAEVLNERIRNSKITTIAYSVNDGFTPIRYKVLADELAYYLSPDHFKEYYNQKLIASVFFDYFRLTGQKKYYLKAIKMDPSYSAADNNYGPLYLSIRKFSQAKKEFLKIANVDPRNPYPYVGLGNIALERKNYLKARSCLLRALKIKNNLPQALFSLALTEFKLKNFVKAKRLFNKYLKVNPLNPESYYFLGRIYEREKKYTKAASFYQDSGKLGFNNIDIIKRLLKVFNHTKKEDLKELIIRSYNNYKNWFRRVQRLKKKALGFEKIKKKMMTLEKKIKKSLLYNERNPI